MEKSTSPTIFPFRAASPSGMSAELNANGSIRRMDCGDIMLNVFPSAFTSSRRRPR